MPSGQVLHANVPNFQAVVRNRWPDGSAKAAVLSGRVALSANVPMEVRLARSSSSASEPVITLATLVALNPQASVDFGALGSVFLSAVINSPWRQTIAGPQMSEWVYRQAVGSDQHLVVWWRVRYYGGSDADVLVGVENGYLLKPNPAQKNYTVTVRINGSQRFHGALEHFHHTRWAMQFWYGAEHQVTPSHDGRYLTDTKLFPNYGWRSPSTAALNGLSSSLVPFARNDFSTAMGDAGYQPAIGLLPIWDALYVTSGDPRAWRSMVANAFSYGRYGVHYRDEATQRPGHVSRHPNLVLDDSAGHYGTGASSQNQYTPGAAQGSVPGYAPTHHPAPPYAAALLTGEWWFIEQVQFVAAVNSLLGTDTTRGFGKGLIPTESSGGERNAGWRLRTLAMAATATPDDDDMQALFRQQWAENMKWYADRYVRGSTDGGAYVNNLGLFKGYSSGGLSLYNSGSGKWWGAGWQMAFVQAALGFAWDLQVGAAQDHLLVRDHAYKLVVGLMGDSSGWDYRRGAPYDFPYSQIDSQEPPVFFPTFKATLDYYEQFHGLTPAASRSDKVLRTGTDAPADDVSFATSYWGNYQPARAYAVEHGAPGAAAGYSRLSMASNFPAPASSALNNEPMWGIVPRSGM